MHNYNLKINRKLFNIQVLESSSQAAELVVNGKAYSVEIDNSSTPPNERGEHVDYLPASTPPDKAQVSKSETSSLSLVKPSPASKPIPEGTIAVVAPIPGSITEIKIKINEPVNSGQVLIKMEAMKMENEICSDIDGIIENIEVSTGDSVQQGQCLVRIEK